MGNKCCGNRKKNLEKQESNSEYTTKDTSKENTEGPKKGKSGLCPYCNTLVSIPLNLKYIECTQCREKSMQDGCTNTLYKYFLIRLPIGHCLRRQGN